MTTATPRTTPNEKGNLYFTLGSRDYPNVFGVFLVQGVSPAEYVKRAFNLKKKYKHLAFVVHVLQNTQNLVILRCCFAENGQEMYLD